MRVSEGYHGVGRVLWKIGKGEVDKGRNKPLKVSNEEKLDYEGSQWRS
ncbi:hypothetical protein BOH78_3436 [Pichia kudriavzevii]|uniref:Uncharacterized protein n=1 Tax=Pichia kudriavzevii TaxID=4909 RepID=A0A1V2LJV5_PICKU|nr:hypothetical protein BOH78_3436 [Pichia kudriavzevii]